MPAIDDVVVVDAVRTPIGTAVGALNRWHAVDLLATVMQEVLVRTGIDPERVDAVIGGCATPVGEQALNVTRNALLAAGWSESIPAHTLDAHAASSMLALHDAAARIASGIADICVVVGVESTRVPEGSSTGIAVGKPYGPSVHERYVAEGGLLPPGFALEQLAKQLGVDRAALDAYAQRSCELARAAQQTSTQKAEIVPLVDNKKSFTVDTDELRVVVDPATLRPMFEPDGLLTAATFAMPADAAVALVVARTGIETSPLAALRAVGAAGVPMLRGSSGTSMGERLLRDVDATVRDLQRVEIREDSAVTPLAWGQHVDVDIVNPNGGALASGDPVGASGLLAVTSLLHGLERDGGGNGLALVAGATQTAAGAFFTTAR